MPAGTDLTPERTSHPYVRGKDIRDGRISCDDLLYVTDAVFPAISRYTVRAGDVCITIVGNIGDVGLTPPELDGANLTENAVKLAELRNDCFAPYVAYALLSPSAQSQMKQSAAGAAQPKMGIYKVNEIKIPLRPPAEQRRIAGILGAYDDLIVNCRRRIRILEEMARALYREWFVQFRYPGHASVPLVDSDLGPIPQGWAVKPIESVLKLHIGGGWGKDVVEDGFGEPAWVIRGTDIPSCRICSVECVPYRFHTQSNLRSRRLEAGDIVFEVSGGSKGQPLGRSVLVTPGLLSAFRGEDVICASFCKRIHPNVGLCGSEFLYLSFLEAYENGEIEQYQVQSTGISNFKWTEYIRQTWRVIPPPEIRQRFEMIAQPLLNAISVLGREASNLRATRDLLLPRLINGDSKGE